MKHSDALVIAKDFAMYLGQACKRIEVAGSVRRCKDEVKDIEFVAIPNLELMPTIIKAEFGKPVPKQYKTFLDELLDKQVQYEKIKFQKNGDKYKKFKLLDWNVSVDLFLVLPPAMWGVQYLIRTGPADFSHWMVTQKRYGDALPNSCRVKDGAVWDEGDNSKYNIHEEIDYFNLCGLGWLEPHEREARWAK